MEVDMFTIKTILPGTGNVQHVVEGVKIPTNTDVTIVNSGTDMYTVVNGTIIKNK